MRVGALSYSIVVTFKDDTSGCNLKNSMGSLQRGMSTDSGLADLCGSMESSGALGAAEYGVTTKTAARLSQRR